MAFYTHDTIYDPNGLFQTPVVQDQMSTWFDFDAYNIDQDLQSQAYFPELDVQSLQQVVADAHAGFFVPADAHCLPDSHATASSSFAEPFQSGCMSPSAYLYPLEDLFNSIIAEDIPSSGISELTSSFASSEPSYTESGIEDAIVPVCQRNHDDHSIANIAWSDLDLHRPPKRKAEESDSDSVSSCSEYLPARKVSKRTPPAAAKKASANGPLPAHLQPIKVESSSGALSRCPMPLCGVELEDRDSAWRGHFKKTHHDDLCLVPGCRGLGYSLCRAQCPFPLPGCKACGDDSAPDSGKGKGKGKGKGPDGMTIESVGRHLLNIHIKVAYQCPLCGFTNQWRESACVRHIRRCMEKGPRQRRAAYQAL